MSNIHRVLFISLLIGGVFLSYHEVLEWMYGRYTSPDSYYSHGFLVPFISGFFVWQNKAALLEKEVGYTLWGIAVILSSILVHLLGTVLYIFSLSAFSIGILIFGTSLFLLGPSITRLLTFPLAFLIFMFPLPQAFIEIISLPLKSIVAEAGTKAVSLFGIPILREGFLITIPNGQLWVGNPCSGLRSLVSLLALVIILMHLTETSIPKKVMFSVLIVPVALLSNVLRVAMLIMISHYWGLEFGSPDSFYHAASGFILFACSLILLLCLRKWLF